MASKTVVFVLVAICSLWGLDSAQKSIYYDIYDSEKEQNMIPALKEFMGFFCVLT